MEDATRELTQQLLTLLPLLNRLVIAEVRHEVGAEATMAQYCVLTLLEAEPITLSTLAKRRRVSLQAMSELVQSLARRGWVTRTPDARDRRQALLVLTAEGHAQHRRIQDQLLDRLEPLLGSLSPTELAAAAHALSALYRALAQEDDTQKSDAQASKVQESDTQNGF